MPARTQPRLPNPHFATGTAGPHPEQEETPTAEQIAEAVRLLTALPREERSPLARQILTTGLFPLTRVCGEVAEPTLASGSVTGAAGPLARLPKPIDIGDFIVEEIPAPPVLVDGLLHQGSKLVISGGSKSYKTWSFIDMALSVASGKPWWGRETRRSKVLYVNFELQPFFFQKRLREVMEARGITIEQIQGKLRILNMRGAQTTNAAMLIDYVKDKIDGSHYGMVLLDPLYKLYGDADENSASNMAELMGRLDDLARSSGAAVLFGHHFSKGNQAGKDMRDRGSGSGAIMRDVDTIMTMTAHKKENHFVIECVPRNFPPWENVVVRREHPLMVIAEEEDAAELRQPGASSRTPEFSDQDMLRLLDDMPLTHTEWLTKAKRILEIGKSTFNIRLAELKASGAVRQDGRRYWRADQPQTPVREIITRNANEV